MLADGGALVVASRPYAIFSGAVEVTASTLLLFRRPTTLGAMVAAAAMTNVVALNFCDDVPVKLYSTNILLMAVFLLVPGAQWRWTILALCQPL